MLSVCTCAHYQVSVPPLLAYFVGPGSEVSEGRNIHETLLSVGKQTNPALLRASVSSLETEGLEGKAERTD